MKRVDTEIIDHSKSFISASTSNYFERNLETSASFKISSFESSISEVNPFDVTLSDTTLYGMTLFDVTLFDMNPFDSDEDLVTDIGFDAYVISANKRSFTIASKDSRVTISEDEKSVTVSQEGQGKSVKSNAKTKIINGDIFISLRSENKDVVHMVDGSSLKREIKRGVSRFCRLLFSKTRKSSEIKQVQVQVLSEVVLVSIDIVTAEIFIGNREVTVYPGKGAVVVDYMDIAGIIRPGIEQLTIYPGGGSVSVSPKGGPIIIIPSNRDVIIEHEGGNVTTAKKPNSSILGGKKVVIAGNREVL